MKSSGLLCGAMALIGALPAVATATPVQWTAADGGNGHYYEFRYDNDNFQAAYASALASTFMGMSGYLATVTSAGENAFLQGISTSTAYIGGSDAASEGTWQWLDGPEAGGVFYSTSGGALDYTYNNWNPGEPNNAFPVGPENELTMNYGGPGGWNDVKGYLQGSLGYFVEYSAAAPTGAIPEPASWALMLAGFGVVGGVLRRRPTTVSVAA